MNAYKILTAEGKPIATIVGASINPGKEVITILNDKMQVVAAIPTESRCLIYLKTGDE